MSLTSYRAAPPRGKCLIFQGVMYQVTTENGSADPTFFAVLCRSEPRPAMHALIEAGIDEKPALQPNAAIGPALRAIAGDILAKARIALTDPERSSEDAVHDFRRAMKQWRALMRLLEPFIPDSDRWRREARDHARSLAHARDGAAALNAFDGLTERA